MEKLEMIHSIRKRFPGEVKPTITSIKYCQDASSAYLEISYVNRLKPQYFSLSHIGGEILKDENGNDADIIPMFNPEQDIVDNAGILLYSDVYSFMLCIGAIFKEDAINRIANSHGI